MAPSPVFGVHLAPSNVDTAELVGLWKRIEDLGFGWISVWDHFYASDLTGTHCHEAISIHTALALSTSRVRCGCLVYCAGYRTPGVLAKAMATIDHLSGGRCDFGIGAGWHSPEYRAFGYDYPPTGVRMDIMEESLECVARLLREDSVTFDGRHVTLADATLDPRPVQERLPVWVGGAGEKRTLPAAARWADGWNVPFVSVETFAAKRAVLWEACERGGRDPAEIRCAVNLGAAPDEDSLHRQFGKQAEWVRPGVLVARGQELQDAIGAYVDAGADQVNLALRVPYDLRALDDVAEAVEAWR